MADFQDIWRRKDEEEKEEDEAKSRGAPVCSSVEMQAEQHKHARHFKKPARTSPSSCANPQEEDKAQKKKYGNLYSTGPPAWTAVKTHVAALRGRQEGSTTSKKQEEAGGWEKKIVSDD